jgi:HAD superfamily hydrolase (TIGR01458 family)
MLRRSIRGVLVDLSGTLHIEDLALPGATEGIKRLKGLAVQLLYVTNTSKESKNSLVFRLNRIGFQVSPDEVFSSLSAARRVVESRKLRPLLLLQKEALEDFDGICLEYPNAVLVGLAPQLFSYEVLNEAFRYCLMVCLPACLSLFFRFFGLSYSERVHSTSNYLHKASHSECMCPVLHTNSARI